MTSVLLCISMHIESGYDSEVDPIVKLIWSKVCITNSITISITISITNLTTNSITRAHGLKLRVHERV